MNDIRKFIEMVEQLNEAKVAVHPVTGKKKRFPNSASRDEIMAWKNSVPEPKTKKPDEAQDRILDLYWNKFVDIVNNVYPDGDPIDTMAAKYKDFDFSELEAAAKKHGYEHPMDYWNDMEEGAESTVNEDNNDHQALAEYIKELYADDAINDLDDVEGIYDFIQEHGFYDAQDYDEELPSIDDVAQAVEMIKNEVSVAEDASDDNNMQVWGVIIMNNYHNGKYADYRGRQYTNIIASNAQEAKQVVLDNADEILKDILSTKLHGGRRLLSPKKARPITADSLRGAEPVNKSTSNARLFFTPSGKQMLKVEDGKIVDDADGIDESLETLKKLAGLSENYGMTTPYDDSPEESVNYTQTKKVGDSTVTISANATDMEELHRVLKLAGINIDSQEGGDGDMKVVEPAVVEPELDSPCGTCDETPPEDDGMGQAYSTDKQALIDMIRQKMQSKFQ